MSQSKGKLIMIVLAFVVLAMASLACGGSDNPVAAAPELTATPWSRQDIIASAYEQGRAVFVFHGEREGLALCNGTTRLASLKEAGKEYMFKFDTQESANLTFCQRNELGNYETLQDISGVSPGDYLSWDSNLSLGWTRH